MTNDEIAEIQTQINVWEERKAQATALMLESDFFDHNWESISRDRRNAQIKIAQLTQKLTYKAVDVPTTVSIPKFNRNYDTVN